LVGRILARLQARGFDDELIGRLSAYIVDEARKALTKWRDSQAAIVFGERLASGHIEFRVRGDAGDWIAPDHIWTSAPETAPQVPSKRGGALERSLFLPVYASDLNDDEKQVAVYLLWDVTAGADCIEAQLSGAHMPANEGRRAAVEIATDELADTLEGEQ